MILFWMFMSKIVNTCALVNSKHTWHRCAGVSAKFKMK